MSGIETIALWLLGAAVIGGAVYGLRRYFSTATKEARRRARNHGPVVTRRRGPSIKLAVDVEDAKPKRKR
jgi:hypothetical protein